MGVLGIRDAKVLEGADGPVVDDLGATVGVDDAGAGEPGVEVIRGAQRAAPAARGRAEREDARDAEREHVASHRRTGIDFTLVTLDECTCSSAVFRCVSDPSV